MNSDLLSQARRLDTLDAIVGPTAAACMWSGSEFLSYVGIGLNAAELVFAKIPFMAKYVAQTNDFKALQYWIPKELVANSSPLTSMVDVVPAYMMRVDYVLSGCGRK